MSRCMLHGNALAALAVLGLSATAQAAPIGYQLDIFCGADSSTCTNAPTFQLTNASASTANIVSFNFTVGDTTRNFDAVVSVVAGGITFILNRPDTVNDAARTDDIDIVFLSGFTPGSVFQFDADIDSDGSAGAVGSIENFTAVFFNNGAAPNSVITVGFEGGGSLNLTLPENPGTVTGSPLSNHYRFVQQTSVPEPGTLALLGAALAGFGLLYRRVVSQLGICSVAGPRRRGPYSADATSQKKAGRIAGASDGKGKAALCRG